MPSLTSNAFLLSAPPHASLLRSPRLIYFAQPSPFSVLSVRNQGQEGQGGDDNKIASANPFFFNIGGVSAVKSLVPIPPPSVLPLFQNRRRKDPNTVFVAGATGQAGIRIAQALLRAGFTVRAGVPDLGAAQDLASLVATYKIISKEESKRLVAVKSSFRDAAESIAKAIGNAGKLVVTVGTTEDGPAAEVTASDALQVVEAARLAGVGHVAIICDGMADASTADVLGRISAFFGGLFSRSTPVTATEFLRRVAAAEVSYTVMKTRLTEDFSPESGYNVVVSAEGREAGKNDDFKVAKSQIAALVSQVFSDTEVAENKVMEVYTHPSASARPLSELLSGIPEDGRRKAYAEEVAKERAEVEARIATQKAQEAAESAKQLGEEVKRLSEREAEAASLAVEAQAKAAAAGTSMDALLSRAKYVDWGMAWRRFVPKPSQPGEDGGEEGEPKVEIATVRGRAKAEALPPKKAKPIMKQPDFRKTSGGVEAGKMKPEDKGSESRSIFRGLFKQETFYVDDD